MVNSPALLAGIEAGGTKFNCIVGNSPEIIKARLRIPTTTPDDTLEKVNAFFQDCKKKYGDFAALGLGCFGPLDLNETSDTYGYITTEIKKGWSNINIVERLSTMLSIPIVFETDVNAAALGEQQYGAAKGIDNFVYITIGTGIGAGVVVNGSLVQGSFVNGMGHTELGHILIPKDLSRDTYEGCCPFHTNCIEGLASGTSIKLRWGVSGDELDENHPAWDLEAHYLAAMCVNITMSFSPEKIVLGGGVMNQRHLFKKIHEQFILLIGGYVPRLSSANIADYIIPSTLEGMSGEYGTLVLAGKSLNHG